MAQGKYAHVNGLDLYYEQYGAGRPLVVLHGGLGTVDMFGQLLPELAKSRQIIAVELQGHGHTADVDRPFAFETMADDVAALVQQLGLGRADLMGYSLGGGVALQTAIRHPDVTRKLAIVSAAFASSGWYPQDRAGMTSMRPEVMVGSPPHEAFVRAAPRPEDWSVLVNKTRIMLSHDYDWSADVAKMKAPTIIAVGDADAVRVTHAVRFFELLGGGQNSVTWDGSGMPNSRLAVLPGTTHYDILASPLLLPAVTGFLEAPMPDAGSETDSANRGSLRF